MLYLPLSTPYTDHKHSPVQTAGEDTQHLQWQTPGSAPPDTYNQSSWLLALDCVHLSLGHVITLLWALEYEK